MKKGRRTPGDGKAGRKPERKRSAAVRAAALMLAMALTLLPVLSSAPVSGAGAEAAATETAAETGTEAESEMEIETEAETDTETEAEAETKTDTETEAGAEKETGTEAETETGTGTETEIETETGTDMESSEETAADTVSETGSEEKTDSESEAEEELSALEEAEESFVSSMTFTALLASSSSGGVTYKTEKIKIKCSGWAKVDGEAYLCGKGTFRTKIKSVRSGTYKGRCVYCQNYKKKVDDDKEYASSSSEIRDIPGLVYVLYNGVVDVDDGQCVNPRYRTGLGLAGDYYVTAAAVHYFNRTSSKEHEVSKSFLLESGGNKTIVAKLKLLIADAEEYAEKAEANGSASLDDGQAVYDDGTISKDVTLSYSPAKSKVWTEKAEGLYMSSLFRVTLSGMSQSEIDSATWKWSKVPSGLKTGVYSGKASEIQSASDLPYDLTLAPTSTSKDAPNFYIYANEKAIKALKKEAESEDGSTYFKVGLTITTTVSASRLWETAGTGYQELTFLETGIENYPRASASVKIYSNSEVEEYFRVKIRKKDADTGANLSGAKYRLYSDAACTDKVADLTTGTDGTAVSAALSREQNRYYLKEITAPTGYEKDTTVYKLSGDYLIRCDKDGNLLSGESWYVYTLSDTPSPITVSVKKEDAKFGGDLAGAEFLLYDDAACTVRTKVSEKQGAAEVPALVSDGMGYAESDPFVMTQSVYYLKETKAPAGYKRSDQVIAVTVTQAEGGYIVLTNELLYTGIRVHKTDSMSGEAVAGVTFGIFAQENVTAGDTEQEVIYQAGEQLETLTTDADGNAASAVSLYPGSYYLQELSSVWGYETDETKHVFTVTASETAASVSSEDALFQASSGTFALTNRPYQPSEISVTKEDLTNGEELAGASLILTDSEGNPLDSWISEEQAHTIAGLAWDTVYTLTEEMPAAGYVTAESIVFRLTKGASEGNEPLTVVEIKNGEEWEALSETDIVMKDDITRVWISKQDMAEGTELPGASLTVTDSEGNVVESWVSGEEPHQIEKLPVGEYVLTETAAPYGYETAEAVNFTVLDTGEIQTVVMKDEARIGGIAGTLPVPETESSEAESSAEWETPSEEQAETSPVTEETPGEESSEDEETETESPETEETSGGSGTRSRSVSTGVRSSGALCLIVGILAFLALLAVLRKRNRELRSLMLPALFAGLAALAFAAEPVRAESVRTVQREKVFVSDSKTDTCEFARSLTQDGRIYRLDDVSLTLLEEIAETETAVKKFSVSSGWMPESKEYEPEQEITRDGVVYELQNVEAKEETKTGRSTTVTGKKTYRNRTASQVPQEASFTFTDAEAGEAHTASLALSRTEESEAWKDDLSFTLTISPYDAKMIVLGDLKMKPEEAAETLLAHPDVIRDLLDLDEESTRIETLEWDGEAEEENGVTVRRLRGGGKRREITTTAWYESEVELPELAGRVYTAYYQAEVTEQTGNRYRYRAVAAYTEQSEETKAAKTVRETTAAETTEAATEPETTAAETSGEETTEAQTTAEETEPETTETGTTGASEVETAAEDSSRPAGNPALPMAAASGGVLLVGCLAALHRRKKEKE